MSAVLKRVVRALPFRHPLFKALRLARPPERLYRHLHFTGVIEVKVSPGARFRMRHWGNQVENDLFWAGFGRGWEGASLRLWRELAAGAEGIADVGANTGVYALSAAAANRSARILAVEPVARVFERLKQNVALNPFDIVLDPRAASSANGVAVLHDTDAAHVYSASLDPQMLGERATLRTEITTAKLDDMLPEHGIKRIDLLKIDVERHEPAVLAGLVEHLRRDRPTMLIEVLDRQIGAEIEQQVDGLGYRFFAIDEARGPVAADHLGAEEGRNYLLCTEAKARELAL